MRLEHFKIYHLTVQVKHQSHTSGKHLCNVPVSVFETTLFHRFLSSKYFGLHHKNPTQFYESIIKLSLWKKQHMRSHDSCFTDITQDPWLTSGSLCDFTFLLFISSMHSCSSFASSHVISQSEFDLTFSPDVLLASLFFLAASLFKSCLKLANILHFIWKQYLLKYSWFSM